MSFPSRELLDLVNMGVTGILHASRMLQSSTDFCALIADLCIVAEF